MEQKATLVRNKSTAVLTLAAISAVHMVIISITAFLLLGHTEVTFACQVIVDRPEIYEESDAIFVGEVVEVERYVPMENGRHINFQVTHSWKGVTTEYVTVHNDNDMCTAFPFIQDQVFLVYGKIDSFELSVPIASGSQLYEPAGYSERDLNYLNERYELIDLKPGHAYSANLLPPFQMLSALVAVAAATFFIIRYRR